MKLIETAISLEELRVMSDRMYGGLVKGVVDLQQKIMVVDVSMHADAEAFLLNRGSRQEDLWGINLYPELTGVDFLEFDSMINIRPSQNNHSRNVEDEAIREKIRKIVEKLVLLDPESRQ